MCPIRKTGGHQAILDNNVLRVELAISLLPFTFLTAKAAAVVIRRSTVDSFI